MLDVRIKKHLQQGEKSFDLDVDFSLRNNNGITVLFGASGSGKSITFQSIAGISVPDEGYICVRDTVLFDSANKIDIPVRKRRIGYMFQDYALLPHLTVAQNVAYVKSGYAIRHLSKTLYSQVLENLDRLSIADLADLYPAQISGGQKQRVALARALSIQPHLLCLDEPFSALDPLLRHRLREDIYAMLRVQAIPSLIITHDPEDVRVFADTLVLFSNGKTHLIANFRDQMHDTANVADLLLKLLEMNHS